jgi:uncharacterized membrane protein (UPF0127 family)
MVHKKEIIFFDGKKIPIDVREVSYFRRGIGLMFRTKDTENLLFNLGKDGRWAITSYFVFFPFLAVWIDKKNRVVEYKTIKPFIMSLKPKKTFSKLIEIPINKKNKKLIKIFSVDKRKI